jgi:hypothetical protein
MTRGNDITRKDGAIRDVGIKGQGATRAKDEYAIRKPRPEIMTRPGKNVQPSRDEGAGQTDI